MTIKWNWGTKIFLVYTGFVVFMLGMVYLCTRQNYDLVSTDYYAQELKYQQVIDGKNNANQLGKAMTIAATANGVAVQLPVAAVEGEGELHFYRPDNASYDFKVPVKGDGLVNIPANQLKTGKYTVKARYQYAGKPYYNEVIYYAP